MFHPTDLLQGPAALLLAVVVANLVALLVAQWLLVAGVGGPDAESAAAAQADRTTDADGSDGRVRCPNCRTTNEAGYRFCRECLGELPGRGRAGLGGADPRRRPMS